MEGGHAFDLRMRAQHRTFERASLYWIATQDWSVGIKYYDRHAEGSSYSEPRERHALVVWADALGLLAPVLVLLLATLVFYLVRLALGEWRIDQRNTVGVFFYGGLGVLWAYILYGPGYGITRVASRITSPRLTLRVTGIALIWALVTGLASMAFASGTLGLLLLVYAAVPLLGGVVSSLAHVVSLRYPE